ncbi:YqgQ family protein [Evansella sp. AB-P1]|uniref:YqgQ family protein n=1 Tax=Evansella sp. AB-P1 TaxID=3037653 RepID=UPI00241D71C5|nr:YqgQ family protein [Evansella sp. AB-P1]MDG5788738.1 YqgQ family protein [Evansella sp. AB-P1]
MTYYELQQFLKKHGTIIYTGDRLGDIELMEEEINELYKMGIIDAVFYRDVRLLLMKERNIVVKIKDKS